MISCENREYASLTSLLVVIVLVSMLVLPYSISGGIAASAQQNDMWYLGKGAKENTYYTYKIQDHDTNQGQPFTMTVFFKDFNETGKYWIAPVFVVDKGKVLNGTFHLSDLDLTALGSSVIPKEMSPYRSAYANTLQWLESFVPRPGQSLSAVNWGKIGSIGGSPVNPGGAAKVTVPAGTYDTTVITYHKGVDNRIWVNSDLPYPVKAETYADVTTGNPPIQYVYDLQATGQGQPPAPESQIEIPKPPLEIQTARGTYILQLLWDPEVIVAGQPVEFGILFGDAAGGIVDRVRYGFKVTEPDGTVLEDLKNQRADDGTGIQEYTFESDGPKDVEVTVDVVGGTPMGEFVESSKFGIVVQPPSGTAAASSQNQTTNTTSGSA
ncbi:MAG: hypothetical protein M3213_02360 [Thermoproteota archaeon]|jgi:hypothetical protein|nr:hypothetical protein [Thermoproteota archaeon]